MSLTYHQGKAIFVTAEEHSLLSIFERRRDFLESELKDEQEQRRLLSLSVRQQKIEYKPQSTIPGVDSKHRQSDSDSQSKNNIVTASEIKSERPTTSVIVNDDKLQLVDATITGNSENQQNIEMVEDKVTERDEPAYNKIIIKKRKAVNIDDLPELIEGDFFPQGLILFTGLWSSLGDKAEDQHFILPNFGLFSVSVTQCNQTLGLQLELPPNAKTWAFSISPCSSESSNIEESLHDSEVLFHFNPRYQNHQLIMNDKQGNWGTALKRSLGTSSKTEAVVSRQLCLMVQIREQGFVVFVNGITNTDYIIVLYFYPSEGVFCDFFVHRRPISVFDGKPLRQ